MSGDTTPDPQEEKTPETGTSKEGDAKTPAKRPTSSLEVRTLDPKDNEFVPIKVQTFMEALELCKLLVDSGFLPDAIKTPAQALHVIMFGQEIGIPPITSLRTIHIINGSPTIAAQMMLAKFLARGGKVRWTQADNTKCSAHFTAGNGTEFDSVFSADDAKIAGLGGKDNYRKWPGDMYRARVIARGVRATDPQAIGGLYSVEEMGGIVTGAGTVITAETGGPPAIAGPIDLEGTMAPVVESVEGQPAADAPQTEPEAPDQNQGQDPEPNAPGASKPFSKMTDEEKTDYASDREEERAQAEAEKETPAVAAPAKPAQKVDSQKSLLDQ